ncbi:MAG TPA: LysM peptidoglycan-binding domain-containing protein [Candidatus Limnocylindrales bacterium]|nr:LysM peptidoglycan-binding domain-containing protein [Candidatus Limnocylindrales bacterium]
MGLEKAVITNTATGANVSVLFNPEEYTLAKDINYAQAAVPGLSAPILQFVHGNVQTLDLELFLDTYEANRDVRDEARKITQLMAIDPGLHAPPPLIFAWGSLSFTCVLAKVSQRFVMFRSDGIPVRARLQVTFNEYLNAELEAKEIKRETADYTKVYVVRQRDTLSAIAGRLYDDPRMWRPIAIANDVEAPRSLDVGRRLRIPQLPFRDPESGEVLR